MVWVATLVETVGAAGPLVEVRIAGDRVGNLSTASATKYLPFLRALVAAGLPPTCRAEVMKGKKGWEVRLSLAQPDELVLARGFAA
jgi:hypothetical protein